MNDNEIILFCAFRYALGRQTYIVGIVADEIIRRSKDLSEYTRTIMAKEIRQAKEYGMAGADMDVKVWDKVADAL